MTTVFNPIIPHIMGIPSGRLRVGDLIIVQGEPLPYANRFSVNLVQHSRNRYIFHFDARFDQGETVRNTNYSGSWGCEERSCLPLQKGRPFFLEIRCFYDRYMVAIDGHHYCEYAHRVSFSEVDSLKIEGDVRVTQIEFRNSTVYPPAPGPYPPAPGPYPPFPNPGSSRLNVVNPRLPFTALINGTISVGGEIQVHGRVNPNPNRFHVNLQKGCLVYPQPTIAFHFNPRFERGNRVIVMNSFDGHWANEERITRNNPFLPNMHFILIIRRQANCYEVHVNGARVASFRHRIMAEIVDAVAIDGDVSIDKVVAI